MFVFVFENFDFKGEVFENEKKLSKDLDFFSKFSKLQYQILDSSVVTLLILRHVRYRYLHVRQLTVALKLHPWRRFP